MGLFDKLMKYVPGGPVSIAKTMLRAHNRYKELNYNATRDEALRYAIESRYQIIKVMNKDEIESCLKHSSFLGDLVLCVIEKEIPAFLSGQIEDKTINDLYNFFKENAQKEIGSIEDYRMSMILQGGITKANSKANWHMPMENGQINYYVIECPNCGRENRINKPFRSGFYKCADCKLLLVEL